MLVCQQQHRLSPVTTFKSAAIPGNLAVFQSSLMQCKCIRLVTLPSMVLPG